MDGSAFLAIFWGFLFTFIRFGLDWLDPVLAALGAVALVWGFAQVRPQSGPLRRARVLAIVLIPSSLLWLWSSPTGAWLALLIALKAAVALLKLLVVWDFCGGLHHAARAWGQPRLASRALLCRLTFTVGYAAWFTGQGVGRAVGPDVSTAVFAVALLPFLVMFTLALAFLAVVLFQSVSIRPAGR